MTTAFWIAMAIVVAIQVVTLKLSVRFIAKDADNAWDNAFAYLLTAGLLIYFPVRWMVASDSFILTLLAGPFCWIAQTIALKTIYEVKLSRAWILGLVHGLISSVVIAGTAFVSGMVAAYIMWGKIVSDPIRAIKLLLRLIGIELPLD